MGLGRPAIFLACSFEVHGANGLILHYAVCSMQSAYMSRCEASGARESLQRVDHAKDSASEHNKRKQHLRNQRLSDTTKRLPTNEISQKNTGSIFIQFLPAAGRYRAAHLARTGCRHN